MKPTPICTKVFDDYTFHFFLEPATDLLGWSKDSKVSVISLVDNFGGECGNGIRCRKCPFNASDDCYDTSVYAAAVPELVELYPEYFV